MKCTSSERVFKIISYFKDGENTTASADNANSAVASNDTADYRGTLIINVELLMIMNYTLCCVNGSI